MNLKQTVSKILKREVSKQEAMEFALNQYGALMAFISKRLRNEIELDMKANPPKEQRVYVLDVNNLEIGFEEMTDEQYIEECEKQGGIYSIEGFQKAFNEEEVNTAIHIIKII